MSSTSAEQAASFGRQLTFASHLFVTGAAGIIESAVLLADFCGRQTSRDESSGYSRTPGTTATRHAYGEFAEVVHLTVPFQPSWSKLDTMELK